jgi:hypothetical protein
MLPFDPLGLMAGSICHTFFNKICAQKHKQPLGCSGENKKLHNQVIEIKDI